MSTKELYEAHALIMRDKCIDEFAYNLLDDAIEQYVRAEKNLRIYLKGAFQKVHGSAPEEEDIRQIYSERFKSVICKLAVKPCKDNIAIPDGSELQQLKFLAQKEDCPRALWQ